MRKFLDSKGVLATNDYIPDAPEEQVVRAFEDHGIMGPDPNAPRVCLTQTFKKQWNKQVVEILTVAFISAVKQGEYKSVQHTWPQMTEDEVRMRCRRKLYRTQYTCRTHDQRPQATSDKINRMHQRRQEVYLVICPLNGLLTAFPRRTTEGGKFMRLTSVTIRKHGSMWAYYLMLSTLEVPAMTRQMMIWNMGTQTRVSRLSGVLIRAF